MPSTTRQHSKFKIQHSSLLLEGDVIDADEVFVLGVDGGVDAYFYEGDGVLVGVDADDVEVVLRTGALTTHLATVVDMEDVHGVETIGGTNHDTFSLLDNIEAFLSSTEKSILKKQRIQQFSNTRP